MSFPALIPSARRFTPSQFPVTRHKFMTGQKQSMLFASNAYKAELRLVYANRSTSEIALFMAHYDKQDGTHGDFKFPGNWAEQVWGGLDKVRQDEKILAINGRWRYAAPPRITQQRGKVATAEVVLLQVPGTKNVRIPGAPPGTCPGAGLPITPGTPIDPAPGAPTQPEGNGPDGFPGGPANPGSGGGGSGGPGSGNGGPGSGGGGGGGAGPGGDGGGIPADPPTPNDPDYPGRPTPEELGCPEDYFVRPICFSYFTSDGSGGTNGYYSIGEPIIMPTEQCYACTGGASVPCFDDPALDRKRVYMPNHVDLRQVSACNLFPLVFGFRDCVCFSSDCIDFPTWVSGEVVGWTCCETEEMWDPNFESSWGIGCSNDPNCNSNRAKQTYSKPKNVVIKWNDNFDHEKAIEEQAVALAEAGTPSAGPFPRHTPSRRSMKYGEWNTKKSNPGKSNQSVTLPLPKKSIKSEVILDLVYANRPDGVARDFMNHYLAAAGEWDDFKLPNEELKKGPMAGWSVKNGDRYLSEGRWAYNRPPLVESVHPGTSTVTVQLISLESKAFAGPGVEIKPLKDCECPPPFSPAPGAPGDPGGPPPQFPGDPDDPNSPSGPTPIPSPGPGGSKPSTQPCLIQVFNAGDQDWADWTINYHAIQIIADAKDCRTQQQNRFRSETKTDYERTIRAYGIRVSQFGPAEYDIKCVGETQSTNNKIVFQIESQDIDGNWTGEGGVNAVEGTYVRDNYTLGDQKNSMNAILDGIKKNGVPVTLSTDCDGGTI